MLRATGHARMVNLDKVVLPKTGLAVVLRYRVIHNAGITKNRGRVRAVYNACAAASGIPGGHTQRRGKGSRHIKRKTLTSKSPRFIS